MKSTGIVRRIDELGRIVIPKEIRKTQHIREGDALEIFAAADGEVVFKKYSPLGGLGQPARDYAEVLAKSLGCAVVVCDRGSILAAAGLPKSEAAALTGCAVSPEVEHLLAARRLYKARPGGADLRLCERGDCRILCAAPIVVQGDVEGGVLLTGGGKASSASPEAAAAVGTAAAFLAKCLE